MNVLLVAILGCLMSWSAAAAELSIVSFNVESDRDTNPSEVAKVMGHIPSSDLWALVEVDGGDLERYRTAINPGYRAILSRSGQVDGEPDDRMALVYNPLRLVQLGKAEELTKAGGSRFPLKVRFRLAETGQEIWVVVNHLQRGNKAIRRGQAKWLNAWMKGVEQTNPEVSVVLAGDFNFDLDPLTLRGNRAHGLFTSQDRFTWAMPSCVRSRTCPATGSACNPRYNSILDFIFMGGGAREWSVTSDILFVDDAAYCKRERIGGSDHRPVRATFKF